MLKDHILQELTGETREFTPEEHLSISFQRNRLYRHKAMRINYTTYDMRRDQDSINPRTHPDIMLQANIDEDAEDQHPFWYARVLGVFHVNVIRKGHFKKPRRTEFLWVRWFGRDVSTNTGFSSRRLHRVGFIDGNDSAPFGFVNPKDVIRAVHLIPAYSYGRTQDILPPSICRQYWEKDSDWALYYVNMLVFP